MSNINIGAGKTQFFDAVGNPLAGGTVDFYTPGTTIRKATYQDTAGTTQNSNPVILDATGRALIYGIGLYRQIVKDVQGNLITDTVVAGSTNDLDFTNLAAAAFRSYNSTSDALSQGVLAVTITAAGSGGTDGSYPVTFSGGGGTGAKGYVVVSGGKIINFVLQATGVQYTTSPVVTAAIPGNTTYALTATISQIATPTGDSNSYFYVGNTGDPTVALYVYQNVGGVAVLRSSIPTASALNTATSAAAGSAAAAAGSAAAAAGSAAAAAGSAAAAATTLVNFTNQYYGARSTDPTVRPDSSASQAGDLYFNTTIKALMEYTGTAWVTAALSPTDLASTATGKGASLVGTSDSFLTAQASLNARPALIANVAAVRALNSAFKPTAVQTVGYYTTAVNLTPDGGSGVYIYDSSDTTTADNGGTVLVDAASRRWKLLLTGAVNARQFGAKGDGSTNDGPAIVAAINSGGDVKFTAGTYLLTTVSAINNNGYQRVYGEGLVTFKFNLPTNTHGFTLAGPTWFENITCDFGNGFCNTAFLYSQNVGHIKLKNITFKNLKDTNTTTGSVGVLIPPTGNTFDIDGIRASSLLKKGNGIVTDAGGSFTLIYIGTSSGSAQGSIKNVFVSEIHNIDGSNNVIYEDTAVVYIATDSTDKDNDIAIDNIQGINFGKRLLKIHASNVRVTNVLGDSTTGDSTAVITFLNAQGLGEKYGCSASGCRAYGNMEAAFSTFQNGAKLSDIIAYVQPGTKAGMSNAGTGLIISGPDTEVDGLETGSDRLLTIGYASAVVTNTRLKNIKLVFSSSVTGGFNNSYDTTGFDGLIVDGLYVVYPGISTPTPVDLETYINGSSIRARNISFRNIQFVSAGLVNSLGLIFGYAENISLTDFRYNNTSGTTHLRTARFDNCINVNVDSVVVEGATQIGVYLNACTGRNTVNRVQATAATVAAVYNNNSADVIVQNCDTTKVSGATTATPMNTKYTINTTANRPTTGLVAGFSQHFDTTLGKPIWWNGSVWKDATGTTV